MQLGSGTVQSMGSYQGTWGYNRHGSWGVTVRKAPTLRQVCSLLKTGWGGPCLGSFLDDSGYDLSNRAQNLGKAESHLFAFSLVLLSLSNITAHCFHHLVAV